LGGDSLLATLILSRVKSKLNVDLPMAKFWDAPAIGGLAGLVRRFEKDASYARMQPWHAGGEGLPYFNVPGVGADVAVVKNKRWVQLGRPVYGMKYRGIDGVERPHDTVEEIAAYLVEEMRKIQPEGPYHVGGVSFGGMVAFEAARQLREMGEETALLVMMDTRVEGHAKPRKEAGLLGYCERALLCLLPVGEQMAFTRESLKGALRQARYRVSVPFVRRRCARKGRPLPEVYRFYDLLNRAVAAKRRYQVKAYDGPVALFRFSEQAPDRLYEVEPTLGWGPYCPNLDIHDLPGKHGDLGRNPEAVECYYEAVVKLLAALPGGEE
jgi:thioesterase domain-containing protein